MTQFCDRTSSHLDLESAVRIHHDFSKTWERYEVNSRIWGIQSKFFKLLSTATAFTSGKSTETSIQ